MEVESTATIALWHQVAMDENTTLTTNPPIHKPDSSSSRLKPTTLLVVSTLVVMEHLLTHGIIRKVTLITTGSTKLYREHMLLVFPMFLFSHRRTVQLWELIHVICATILNTIQ